MRVPDDEYGNGIEEVWNPVAEAGCRILVLYYFTQRKRVPRVCEQWVGKKEWSAQISK
jgi:hypothetical protein